MTSFLEKKMFKGKFQCDIYHIGSWVSMVGLGVI